MSGVVRRRGGGRGAVLSAENHRQEEVRHLVGESLKPNPHIGLSPWEERDDAVFISQKGSWYKLQPSVLVQRGGGTRAEIIMGMKRW